MILLLSNNSGNSIETAGSLLSQQSAETIGSMAFFNNACETFGGFDSFGNKDIFGTIDYSNINNFTANASDAETIGSMAFAGVETIGSVASSGFEGSSFSASGFSGSSCGGGGGFSSFC